MQPRRDKHILRLEPFNITPIDLAYLVFDKGKENFAAFSLINRTAILKGTISKTLASQRRDF